MLYVHFDRDNLIDAHIIYQLRAFRDFGCDIIFISNSQLPESETDKVKDLVDEIVLRENRGYDWAAWRDVLFAKGLKFFDKYDELLLMNCTCYGPIFPLHEMFDCMAQKDCDFWMPTKHTCIYGIPEHGQPYLLIVRKKLLKSNVFWNYWQKIKDEYETFEDVVLHGEIRLSTVLSDAGFRYSVYAEADDLREMSAIGYNEPFLINAADSLIAHNRLPLVKVKSFRTARDMPFNIGGDIIRSIKKSGSHYPVSLIYKHLRRCNPLSWQKNLPETMQVIDSNAPVVPRTKQASIGVFGHFFYPDRFKELIDYLAKIPCSFDLLATTTTEDCALEISRMAKEKLERVNTVKVRVVPNRGRDAAPWLMEFRDEHLSYDIALKVQSQKHSHLTTVFGYKWNNYLFDSMLASEGYISEIIKLFDSENKLGIVFPTYPPIFNMANPHAYVGTPYDQELLKKIFEKIGLNPPLQFSQPIFPTGVFWYRPKALEKLLQSDISLKEFHREPFPTAGTFDHTLERAIPYIVQGQGYYYKLAMTSETLVSSFQMYEDKIMSDTSLVELVASTSVRSLGRILVKAALNSYRRRFPRLAIRTARMELTGKKIFNKYVLKK